jgi:hypothetical protein
MQMGSLDMPLLQHTTLSPSTSSSETLFHRDFLFGTPSASSCLTTGVHTEQIRRTGMPLEAMTTQNSIWVLLRVPHRMLDNFKAGRITRTASGRGSATTQHLHAVQTGNLQLSLRIWRAKIESRPAVLLHTAHQTIL